MTEHTEQQLQPCGCHSMYERHRGDCPNHPGQTFYTQPRCTYCYDGARTPNADGGCPACGGAGHAY